MSVANVLDGICTYFGGQFDPDSRTYRQPQIDGLGVVRRAWTKRDDHADYYLGMAPGALLGSQMVVAVTHIDRVRRAFAGQHSGLKQIRYKVELNCFLRSTAPAAEDAQDAFYAFEEAVCTFIETDRTLGTGGFEAGYGVGFQVGEGDPWLSTDMGAPVVDTELTKGFLLVSMTADQFIQA